MLGALRQRNFALLWFAGLISMTGDWVLLVGLPILVFQLTSSPLATALALVAGRLPSLLFGPLAGVFADRWDRRRTMIAVNLLLAASLLPLLLVHTAADVWLVYLVLFVQSCLSQFFDPAEHALLPRLVSEQHLVAANALNSLNNNLARLLGPVLGGLVATSVGLGGVVLLDAISFLLAAALIALITGQHCAAGGQTITENGRLAAVGRELREGLRAVRQSRPLTIIFGLMTLTSVGEGVFGVLFVVFVSRVLNGGAQELGWLMSAQAVGGLLGALVVGTIGARVAPSALIGVGMLLFGLIDLAIFNYPAYISGLVLGITLFILVGIPATAGMTGVMTVLQAAVTDSYRGRVFAAFSTLTATSALVGTLIGGLLADTFGVVTVLNIQGFGLMLAGVAALLLLRSAQPKATLKPKQAFVQKGNRL